MKCSVNDKSYLTAMFSAIIENVDNYLASLENIFIGYDFKNNIIGISEIVSDPDKKIEGICIGVLKTFFPDTLIIAEESYDSNIHIDTDTFFVVDPIDGSSNFLAGGNNWSVSISLILRNKPIVGFLYFPKKRINILSIEYKGVWLNNRKMKPMKKTYNLRIAVSPNQLALEKFKAILIKNSLNFTAIPHFTPKILSIITGEVNAALYLPQKGKCASLWDYAAASLVLQELDGKIKSMSGRNLEFNGNQVIHTDGWVASDSNNNISLLSSMFQNIYLDIGVTILNYEK